MPLASIKNVVYFSDNAYGPISDGVLDQDRYSCAHGKPLPLDISTSRVETIPALHILPSLVSPRARVNQRTLFFKFTLALY